MNIEKLKKTKRLLIIVDMIKGFITMGVLHDPYIDHITPEIARLIEEEFTHDTDLVIFANDEHDENATEFERFGNKKHAVKGSEESRVIDKLKHLAEGKWTIGKNSTSLYVKDEFRDSLAEMEELEEVVIVGDCSDMCVMNLALPLKNHFEERNLPVRVIVPQNANETVYIPSLNGRPEHVREEWYLWANKFMEQAGIETPKQYMKRKAD